MTYYRKNSWLKAMLVDELCGEWESPESVADRIVERLNDRLFGDEETAQDVFYGDDRPIVIIHHFQKVDRVDGGYSTTCSCGEWEGTAESLNRLNEMVANHIHLATCRTAPEKCVTNTDSADEYWASVMGEAEQYEAHIEERRQIWGDEA